MRHSRFAHALVLIAATLCALPCVVSARGADPAQANVDAQRRSASALAKQVRSALRSPDPTAAEAALEELASVDPAARSLAELRAQVRARRVAFDERRAVVAFLSGDYEVAATTIERTRAAGPVPPRATFYLACSRAALAATATDSRDPALDEARRLYRQATATPGFSPNWRYVSPAIRNVLEGRPTPAGGR